MKFKKAESLSLSTIIILIIVVVVLIVVVLFFTKTSGSLFDGFRDRANASIGLVKDLPKP